MPRILHEELDRLPERLRAPIVLCYLEGMTHERAASHLRWPVGTVRSRLARARALLHGRLSRRGLVVTSTMLGGLLPGEAGAWAVRPHVPKSLVKTAARIAAGTASLRDGSGISERVAILLEGVLNVLKVKQIIGSMAALAVIGIITAVAGLSVFPASGQTDSDPGSRRIGANGKPVGPPLAETIVKTYYVGDLLIPSARVPQGASPGRMDPTVAGTRRYIDMTPLIELITSTVAKGTWTIQSGQAGQSGRIVDGRLVETKDGVVTTRTVGMITPFFLSISLIVRHTAEVHDEVASLLRNLRQFLGSRESPSIVAGNDRDREATGVASPSGDQKPAPPASTPPDDRNSRIRRLLDELQREVEKLPKGQG